LSAKFHDLQLNPADHQEFRSPNAPGNSVPATVAFRELNCDDIRKRTLIDRKVRLAKLLAKPRDGIEFNEHIEGDGARTFEHACRLGHEGIIAKRKDAAYESGRSKR
jgi:ATP-dependent DNA ligase